jgi:ATP-dependent phosphofructokinase / diphosphate-dependent phosphofructokinase
MSKRIALMTGGGDAPGLNAVIRAFVKYAVREHRWEVVGIEDSFDGVLERPERLVPLDLISCRGLLHRGGTVLGTTNRSDPFAFRTRDGRTENRVDLLLECIQRHQIDGLVCIGGDGTQAIAWRLMQEHGIPVVGVPKTIDNDLSATDYTFGFQSAVTIATEALDRLHTTAESHERVMVLEVMGRDAGHIALTAGMAGGADIILLPEIPYDPARVAKKIRQRQERGRPFSIAVVAEGALPAGTSLDKTARKQALKAGGGAGAIAVAALSEHIDSELRLCVLGHLQRGGSPVPFDRVLATRFGVGAVNLIASDRWGEMVCLRDGEIRGVRIEEAIATYRLVDVAGAMVRAARSTGIEFGG